MKESLQTRLKEQNERPITDQMQHRWIKQFASAAAWLEQLDYFHGDMRPGNILLDGSGHVKLCDFGNTTKRGEELPATTYPYYRLRVDRSSPLAGPASEQFAMGSCIYTIRTGHEPLDHLKRP
ncbi:kinase-like domain-containing protein [Rhexocercosporidium sp. MPI-PUGE-AT-0058]|nr:kinase-like domain-containing protein [Rhexocercosporidium sp. MPI-PUGE-AT-0058]